MRRAICVVGQRSCRRTAEWQAVRPYEPDPPVKRPFRFVPYILAATLLFGAGWQTGYFVSRRHLQTAYGMVQALRLGSHSEVATAQLYSANVTEAQILELAPNLVEI